jgi:hypothetical protein
MSEYVFKWALKMAGEGIKSVTVKSDVMEAWNVYIQEIMKRTAWSDSGCGSWNKKGSTEDGYRTGITATYPGSMNHFREMLSEIRGEDFDIEYLNPVNRWAQIVGNGLTERDAEDRDLAPYLASTFKGENMVWGRIPRISEFRWEMWTQDVDRVLGFASRRSRCGMECV